MDKSKFFLIFWSKNNILLQCFLWISFFFFFFVFFSFWSLTMRDYWQIIGEIHWERIRTAWSNEIVSQSQYGQVQYPVIGTAISDEAKTCYNKLKGIQVCWCGYKIINTCLEVMWTTTAYVEKVVGKLFSLHSCKLHVIRWIFSSVSLGD